MYLCIDEVGLFEDWAGQDIDGIQRLTMPFVRLDEGITTRIGTATHVIISKPKNKY